MIIGPAAIALLEELLPAAPALPVAVAMPLDDGIMTPEVNGTIPPEAEEAPLNAGICVEAVMLGMAIVLLGLRTLERSI